MKLQNWILCLGVLFAGMAQYSANAAQSIPAYSGDFSQITFQEATTDLININEASADELATLPGLGAKKALAIVEYRKLNGKFRTVEELVNVRGIGPKMMAKLDGLVVV